MGNVSRREVVAGLAATASALVVPGTSIAQVTAFKQAVAEAAARDRDIAKFYQATGYAPLWTGNGSRDKSRRQALVSAVGDAGDHGLPEGRYNPDLIKTNIRKVKSDRDLGRLEVEMSRMFLQYARDVQTGLVTPSRADEQIVRGVPLRPRDGLLLALSKSSVKPFFKGLPPGSTEYKRLLKAKLEHERLVGRGDWGPEVRAKKLERGMSGAPVVELRNRLIRMGYLRRNSSATYDDKMVQAVAVFQRDHGLVHDGVAGPGTLAMLNVPAAGRLSQIMVAMERERWINTPGGRGDRHVWVNLPDFRTRIYDKGRITFETKSVVGAGLLEKRTPEFSDMMEYMEINPDWTVPRSIIGRDYLPRLQANPNAARYLQLIDVRGRVIPADIRAQIDFSQYSEKTFPFTMRQPPGRDNALGTVKFMFPNQHAIYLHDTPERHLFQREVRTFSSGCVRLHDPHEFAYALLKRQIKNPEPYFQDILQSNKQTIVPLEQEVPVHLDYRTAFTEPKGPIQFRRDIYGRDASVWREMERAGVALRSVQS